MKKFSAFILIAAMALVGSVFAPNSAEAVPSYARQVGVPCFACHTMQIPILNAFGREFKLGGNTQVAQELVEDDGISLPATLNAAFIVKEKFVQNKLKSSNDPKVGVERGEWQLGGSAFFIAGRLGENWGLVSEGFNESVKVVYSSDFGGVQGGVSIYNTGMMGAAFSMELYNTGAVPSHRLFENRSKTLIQNALGGPSVGAATGVSVFAGGDLFFLNVGLTAPANSQEIGSADVGFDFSNYYRLAITPKIAEGMDFMIGVQGITGTTKATTTGIAGDPIAQLDTNVMTIDAQLSGEAGGMSYMVVAAYQTNAKDNDVYTADANGMSVNAILGLTPMAGVKVAWLNVDKKPASTDYSYLTLGGYYNFAQNILLDLEYSAGSGEGRTTDSELLLMLQVGF